MFIKTAAELRPAPAARRYGKATFLGIFVRPVGNTRLSDMFPSLSSKGIQEDG